MKIFIYRGIEIGVGFTTSRGRYKICGLSGKYDSVKTTTNDSEIYDYCDDDSNKERMQWAKRSAYECLRDELENQ